MKTLTKCIKLLAFTGLLMSAKPNNAQTCTTSFSAVTGSNGNANFYATAVGNSSVNPGTFYWYFGNGSTTNGVNLNQPSTTYTANGTYVVSLAYVNSAASCSSIATQTIIINNAITPTCNLVANFTQSVTANGAVYFVNTSTGTSNATTYLWNFGNGNTSTSNSPSYTYPSNGNYVVTLTASNNSTPVCTSVKTKSITISGVITPTCNLVANFSQSVTANGVVYFVNTSTGTSNTTTYLWNFGNGNTSTSNSPSYTYPSNGNYVVTLTASNNSTPVCTSVKTKSITISGVITPTCNLVANFSQSVTANGVVYFVNTSTGTSNTTTYLWNFGNGNTSTSNSPSYSFPSNGTYIVTLTASNNSTPVCTSVKTKSITISGVITPTCNLVANFSQSVTANGVVYFVNTSTGTSNTTTYLWNFGNGNTSTSNSPSYTFPSNGNYVVTLTASNNSTPVCTSVKTKSITISGVITPTCNLVANFSQSVTANGVVYFVNTSTGTSLGTSYKWKFGDSTNSTSNSPIHTYASNGIYVVRLKIKDSLNPSCSSVKTKTITISNVVTSTCIANSNFSLVPTGTPKSWMAIPATGTTNVLNASWSWGDGSFSNTLYTSHTYSIAGNYTICLRIIAACGHTSTTCYNYAISKPSSSDSIDNNEMIYIEVLNKETVGIANITKDVINYSVYPNPNTGSFEVKISGVESKNATLSVYSTVGDLIYETTNETANGNLTKNVQLNDLSNGVYFVKVAADNKVITKKIIINK